MHSSQQSDHHDSARWDLRLYVAGRGEKSARAVRNVTALCEELLGAGRFNLQITDIIEQPLTAEHEQIIAVPMLVRIAPEPRRRIIGDLSDRQTVSVALNLSPQLTSES